MRRRTFLRKSALLSAGFVLNPMIYERSENYKNLKVVTLTGSPRKRGQIYGETLKKEISEIVALWKENLQRFRSVNPDNYIKEFLDNTNFTKAIKKWTPDLLDEVKGIAEGTGIDFKTIFAYQLGDEEWWYGRNRRFGITLPEQRECSAIGVFKQKGIPPLLAQNMDIPVYTDGYQVLLHIKHEKSSLESFVFTFAGYIATTGVNNHSIGICCNTLLQLNPSPAGLPVAYIVRGVLAQKTYKDAIKFIQNVKHASGQNYTIGGPEEIVDFECSANKVKRFIPYRGATEVYHTNHPIVNDDQSIFKEILKKIPPERRRKHPTNSEIRLNTIKKRIKESSGKITVETIKSILSSHDDPDNPICNHKRQKRGAFTAGCLIMELSETPVLHLAPGPPCSTEFETFRF